MKKLTELEKTMYGIRFDVGEKVIVTGSNVTGLHQNQYKKGTELWIYEQIINKFGNNSKYFYMAKTRDGFVDLFYDNELGPDDGN